MFCATATGASNASATATDGRNDLEIKAFMAATTVCGSAA
jgi:hypothetical protein